MVLPLKQSEAKRPATITIETVVGDGDFTTFAAAFAAVTTAGARIKVGKGTFALTAAATQPNGPVLIEGEGIGVTVIDIATNVIDAFVTPNNKAFRMRNVTIKGGALVGQVGIHDTFAGARTITTALGFDNVEVGTAGAEIETFLKYDGASFAFFRDCVSDTPGATTDRFLGGTGVLPTVFVNGCDVEGSIDGGGGFGVLGRFSNSFFRVAVVAEFFLLEDGQYSGCRFNRGQVRLKGGTVLSGSRLVNGSKVVLKGSEITISGIDFGSGISGAAVETDGTLRSKITVSGCTQGSASADGCSWEVTDSLVSGCTNWEVVELGASDRNTYTGNSGFFPGSTIIGPLSRVEGARPHSQTGSTTGAFVELFTHTNINGVVGAGTIKNTGGVNALDVKETVVDLFGTTSSVTTPVAFGADAKLDPTKNIGTARPPYKSYKVEVSHPVAATTFDVKHVTHGAEA